MSAHTAFRKTNPTTSASSSSARSAARRKAEQRRRPRLSRLLAWLLSAVLGHAGLAYAQVPASALPTGGQVKVGNGQLQQSANLLIVNQSSQRLGMDWQSFNIGAGATVEFRQPSASSISLNRVVGHSGSEIYGQLRANGQVFLTNPNGVLFAPGAKVDVGGLVASTLDLSQADFADGRFVFSGTGNGKVVNQGSLRANAGGYLALFGKHVDNQGEVAVDAGAVVLASGRAATVSISGGGLISAVVTPGDAGSVINSGSIGADGGVVRLSAASAEGLASSLVNNSGLIRANTLVERAGEIWITGDHVATSGQIEARATESGDAGRVMLLGDMRHGTAQVAGSINASAKQGQGGFVETSAATVNVDNAARVVTTAPGGSAGLWLIDPNDYTIAPSGGNITGATLSANLGGGNVTILTTQQGTAGGNGDIFVNDAVSWAGTRLTLQAERNIAINAPITGTTAVGGGAASLSLEYGQAAVAAGNTSTYTVGAPVTLPAGANFLTKLGSNGSTNTFTVVVDAAGLQGLDSLSRTGNFALGANIDLSSISNFNPIGNEASVSVSTTNSFGGRFDGLGHTVSGLTTSGFIATGLFASTTNADIRNLTLSGGSVSGTGYAGAVAGVAGSATQLTRVSSSTPVSTSGASYAVGGLVGLGGTGSIISSSVGSVGNPVAISGGNHAGGLVGSAGSTTITGSSAAITFTGSAGWVGGLVGLGSGAISGSSATGTVQSSANSWIGGLAGQATGTVSNSTASVDVTTTNVSSYAGGLVGNGSAAISGSSASGNVTGGARTGGLVGSFASASSISGSSASGNVSSTVANADVGGLVGNASGAGSITGSSATGNVTAGTNASSVGGLAGEFSMTAGVINSSSGTAAAGGNPGSTVAGGTYTGGVVGYYNSGTALVTDSTNTIVFRGASVSGTSWVGGTVGYMQSTAALTGLSASANVTASTVGSGAAGGLVGRSNGNVAGASATGNVAGQYTVGGLIGQADGTGTLASGSATGSVTGVSGQAWIGGLVGRYSLSGAMSGTISATGVVSGGSSAGGVVGYYNSTAAISGLTRGTASVSGQDWVGGLIGYSEATSITGSSSAANVTSTGVSYAAGGLVGRTTGAVSSSSASGTVTAAGDAGGLIGRAEGTANLSNASATGNVTSTGPSARTGGLVGLHSAGTISNSQATGTVVGAQFAGGLVGSGSGSYNFVTASGNVTGSTNVGGLLGMIYSGGTVSNALASGNVTSSGSYSGGLIGSWQFSGNITDSRATGNVVNTYSSGYSGGLVGYAFTSSNTATINNSSAAGNVTGGQYVGGLGGFLYDTQIVRGTATGNVSTTQDSSAYVGGLVGGYQGYYYSTAQISNSSATGAVFADSGNAYAGGLVGYFSNGSISTSTASGNVTARDSINANNTSHWVGGLVGQFSGVGISDSAASGNVGSGNVGSAYYSGGLVGYYNGSAPISNSSATGDVTGSQYVGGLVGYHINAGINNGVASGKVTSTSTAGYTGGLVGFAYVYAPGNQAGINDSRASGQVSGGTYVGGLIGYMQDYNSTAGTVSGITNSRASGNVSGDNTVGGLVGYYTGGYNTVTNGISNSSASGNVEGQGQVGGLVGYHTTYGGIRDSFATGNVKGLGNSSDKALGGLVGEFQTSHTGAGVGVVTRSYASGGVSLASTLSFTSGTDVYAGGLIGTLRGSSTSATALTDSYATGAVTMGAASLGNLRAAGLVGQAVGAVTRTYSTGAVSATGGNTRVVGGLVAVRNASSAVTSSYWATDTSGQASSFGGTASTLASLKTATTFAGWDLATAAGTTQVWRIYDGFTTPLLRGLLTPLTVALADINKVYDGTTNLGPVAINVGGTAVVNPDRIFVTGVSANAGTYGLTAANLYSVQNGYDLSLSGTANLIIGQRTLTLSGLVANKVYDGTQQATLASNPRLDGLVAGESLTFAPGSGFSAQFASKTVGTGKTVNLAGSYTLTDGAGGLAANYVLPTSNTTTADITPATLTAGSFTATNRVYDGTTTVAVSATSATLAGAIAGDNVSVDLSSVSSGTTANKNVGTSKPVTVNGVSITGSDAGNYVLAGVGGVTVDITPKPLTVNGINATDRVYNANTNISLTTGSISLAGLVSGDLVDARETGLTGRVADKNVGNGKAVTVTGLGLRGVDAANYTAQAGAVSVNISPYLLTLAIAHTSSSSRVYDGTTSAATYFPTYWYGGDNIVPAATSIGYADKNVAYNGSGVVTSKTITASGISISGTDAANYTLQNTSDTLTGTITPKPLTVSGVSAVNRVYDGTRDVQVTINGATVDTSAVVAGDTVSVATPGSGSVLGQVANKNVGTAKAVTVPGLTLTGADAGNYSITSSTGGGVTVNITQKDVTASYTAADKVYDGGTTVRTTATTTDFVAGDVVSFLSNDYVNLYGYNPWASFGASSNRHVGTGKTVTISYDQLSSTDGGNYRLINPGLAAGNASITTTASITPKPVNLAFNGGTKVYDGGTTANVTLNFGSSGLFSGDTLVSSQTADYTGATAKNVGTGKAIAVSGISLSGANANNYTVGNTTATTTGAITAKPITVSGISAVDRAYDGTTTVAVSAGTVTSSGFVAGDTVAVSLPSGGLSTGTMTNKNVGTNKPVTVTGLTLTGGDAGNYSIDPTSSGITVNIAQAALTPTYLGVNRVYNGGVSVTVTPTTTGIAAGDVVNFSQQAVFTGSTAKDVGTSKPVSVSSIVLSGSGAANYTLASTTATTTADVTAKPVNLTYTGSSRVYNGLLDVSASVVGSSLQFVAGDQVGVAQTAVFTGDGSVGINKPVAITGITLTGAQATNYSLLASTASTTASITPRPLGVTGITATNRVYDGTTSVAVNVAGATVNTSSVIAGDVVSVTLPSNGISTGTLADRNVGNNKPVAITGLTIAGASASNYTLIGATGLTVNITPKSLTAVYAGLNKVYDGTADAQISASSSDILSVDNSVLGFSAQGLFTAGKNVGANQAVSVSGAFLTGTAADNYSLLNPSGSTTADITPRTLTATFTGGSKVYDGGTVAPVTSALLNRVTGDIVGTTQSAVFTGTGARDVGTGKAISVSGITLTGTDAANYTLGTSTGSTTGSVTRKPITVSGLSNVAASDRVYDGTTQVAVTVPGGVTLVPNSSDIIAGDTVTIDVPVSGVTTGTMINKNAGNAKAVSVDGLTLSGTDAGNYSIAGTAGITVNITPKSLTATYSGVNRVYDGTTAATVTGTSTDLIAGDSLLIRGNGNFTGAGAKNQGSTKALAIISASLSGADAGNYALLNTTGSATADVTRRQVTPTYAGGSRAYDGTTSAPVSSTVGNFVVGDSVSLDGTAVFTGAGAKNAGTAKAIQVSGISLQGADADNYSLTASNASTTGTITPKSIALTGLTGVTAANRVYDGTRVVSVTVNSSGTIAVNPADIVAGDVVSVLSPVSGLTTGTLVDKNAGNNKALVVDGLTLTGADAGNYSVTATNGITVNIAQKLLGATYTGVNRVYDGTAVASVVGSSSDVVAGDSLTISGAGVFTAGKNAGLGKAISVTSGQLSGLDAPNYRLGSTTGSTSANITPKTVTAAYTGGTRVYDGTTTAPVTGTLSGGIAGDAVTLQESASFTGVGAKNVGTGKAVAVSGISLSGVDAGNYSLSTTSANTTASVTPRPLGIIGLTGVSAVDRAYDGTSVVAVNVSTSGTVTPNPTDLIAGDVVTITAPPTGLTTGTLVNKNVGSNKAVAVTGLTLGGADAPNYSVASTSGVTVNITPKSLTALYTGVDRSYDGSTSASVIGSSSDIVLGDSVLINADGSFTGVGARNAGVGKTVSVQNGVLSSVDAGNYNLLNSTGTTTATITPRNLVNTYAGGSRVYDGTTTATVSRNTSGLIAGDSISVAETAVFTGAGAKNVGSNKAVQISGISLSGSDAGNYALLSTSATTSGSITPRPLNVTGLSGITAVDRVYDGTLGVQVSVSGPLGSASGDIVAGDNVTVNVPGTGLTGGTMLTKQVGQNKSVVLSGLSLSGSDAGNYAIAGTAGLTVNITPRQVTASYAAADKVYDGTTAATISASSSDLIAGDTVTLAATGTFSGSDGRNAGVNKAVAVQGGSLSGTDATNYSLVNTTSSVNASITPKTVTATYSGGSRVYDGTTAAAVARTNTGLIAGDTVALTETATFTGAGAKNVGTGKNIDITGITLSGADAGNYALLSTTASTTGTITPRPLNVTGLGGITATDRVYDGTVNVQVTVSGTIGSASGDVIAGDNVTVNVPGSGLGGGVMLDKSAGLNKPVVLSGLSLSGSDAGNYAIAGTAGLTVNIAQRGISLSGVSAVDRVYDGTTVVALNTSGGSISGGLAGDDLQLLSTGATASMADKNAGAGKAVTVGGLSLGGADAGNYTVTNGSGLTVNIAQRSLVPTLSVADKVYDGNTGARVTLGDNRVAGDSLSLSAAAATYADRNAGNGIAVSVSGVSAAGADAANYLLSTQSFNTTANITRAPVTVAAQSQNKVYGNTLTFSGNEFSTTGLVVGETMGQVALSSAGSLPSASASASPYAINIGNAAGGNFNPLNYSISYVDGQLLVNPRPLTIATNSVVRFANTPNPSSFEFSLSAGGLAGSDTITSVVQAAPAGSATAAGVSVFELQPSGAVFGVGSASNYSLRYSPGLLVVLPVPPAAGESESSGGNVNLAIAVDPAEVAKAQAELGRASASNRSTSRANGPSNISVPALRGVSTPAEISALLSADSQQVTLPLLLKLPLISMDPQLLKLMRTSETPPAP
jgi:filamentous hemagglutinin family protein